MGPADLDRMFASLGGGVAAAVAADEDAAAEDLAFSLNQDVCVEAHLIRAGGWLVVEDNVVPIGRLGHDFVIAGRWIVPLDRAVVRLGAGAPVPALSDVLVALLRRLARAGERCVVGTGSRSFGGEVVRATPSRITLRGAAVVSIPLVGVDYVRLVPSGSADAL